MESKLSQQITYVQTELFKLRDRVLSLEKDKSKEIVIDLIKREREKLHIERKKLITSKENTLFNTGQITMCNKLINEFK